MAGTTETALESRPGARELMKGNSALCEGAIRAGCRFYFGYPITPQNEVAEFMSQHMPEVGGTFLQAESELAAINMVYGAAAAGARVMTSSSSPGISLMQEGLSYLATAELPAVILNVVRCGPGLGNISPHQGDYFQATKGGGHGDYRLLVLAPSTVQEAAELTYLGFELADRYRNPVMILADGTIGQMMEPVDFSAMPAIEAPRKEWALRVRQPGEAPKFHTTIELVPEEMARVHERLLAKYRNMARHEIRFEEYLAEDADILLTAFGTSARVCRSAVRELRKEGIRAGLFRPISVFPFPYRALAEAGRQARVILDCEMNFGQMIEDVALALEGARPLHFLGKHGGMVFEPGEIVRAAREALADPLGAPTRWHVARDQA